MKLNGRLYRSRDWVRVLEGGPAAFQRMQQEPKNVGAVIDSATIAKAKEFDEAWTRAITKFKAGVVETLSDLAVEFAEFWQDIIDSVLGASYIVEKSRRMFGGLEGMTIPELQDALQRSNRASRYAHTPSNARNVARYFRYYPLTGHAPDMAKSTQMTHCRRRLL